MEGDDESEDHLELITKFTNFLKDQDTGDYEDSIETMVESEKFRLLVDLSDLRNHDPDLAARCLVRPIGYLLAFEQALKRVTVEAHQRFELDEKVHFHVGFIGSFGAHHVSPRGLLARFLGKMVCVEGIVTKMGNVRPKMVETVHFCPVTNETISREYRDATSLDGLPTPVVIPKVDQNGNPYEMEFGKCQFKDHQTVTIQEMPEKAPLGQLPRSVDVVLTYDLVDTCKPGDRIQIVGIFRALAGAVANRKSSSFRTVLIANSVQTIGKDVGGLVMTSEDLKNIRAIAKQRDVFTTLCKSIAPSIYGHEYIKRALLLLLLGGMECNLDNGTHLRGDINILMVGDPSTAKSQLLRFVLGIAPLAVSTTGRGSTGVGLTAAVTSDPDTNERRLEAGAMVLADRGVVCIDEFDKMGDADRVAIHEVMEQQTVTIAKAGIHASLNARCSVVAAANPIYGQYDKTSSPQRNVGLPDSLLSRFDLLFIVLDNLSPEHDREISDHVLRMHRYEKPGQEGIPISLSEGAAFNSNALEEDEDDREDMTAQVYQKFNPLLHGGYAAAKGKKDELLSTEFIRKFTHYAKSRIRPVMGIEAKEFICQEYAKLRAEQEVKTLPVTARQLETMIRLASAHAKVRLSNEVEVEDCEEAIRIMRFALYHDTQHDNEPEEAEEPDKAVAKAKRPSPKKKTKKGRKKSKKDESEDESNSSSSSSSEDEDSDGENAPAKVNRKKRARTSSTVGSAAPARKKKPSEEEEEEEEDFGQVDEESDRFQLFQTVVSQLFRAKRVELLTLEELLEAVNETVKGDSTAIKSFGEKEAQAIIEVLEKNNKVMFRDGNVYQI